MPDETPSPQSRHPDEHSTAPSRRPGRVLGIVLTVLLIGAGVAGFVFFGFLAWFGMCGISGCSGGGFGRSTDPGGTRLLIVARAAASAAPRTQAAPAC